MTKPDTENQDKLPEDAVKAVDEGIETYMESRNNDKKPVETEGGKAPVETEGDKTPVETEGDKTPDVDEEDETPKNDEVDDKDDVNPEDDKDENPEGGKAWLTDDLITKAVKAGMSVDDARKIGNAESLNFVIERLTPDGDESDTGDKGKNSEGDGKSLADGIPDLDPEEYDENIIAGFKGMKDIIRTLEGTLNSQNDLMKNLQSNGSNDWFAEKVKSVGDDYSAALSETPERRNALLEKFNILSAGYKAAGKDVDRDAVFNEAAAAVLDKPAAELKAKAKSDALKKRQNQHISRPSHGKGGKPDTDPLEEVAKEMDQKYFKS